MEIEFPDPTITLHTHARMTNAEFEAFCFANPELVIEREADGTLSIMSPVSLNSGNRETEFIADLKIYARKYGGEVFSSSTGFTLPDTSIRSPDAAYVFSEKLEKFSKEDLDHFAPVVPDFIVEVKSPTDSIEELKTKMRDTWIANGVRLAWLVDVDGDRMWIYRADDSVSVISPLVGTVDGEDVLKGFTFDLSLLM